MVCRTRIVTGPVVSTASVTVDDTVSVCCIVTVTCPVVSSSTVKESVIVLVTATLTVLVVVIVEVLFVTVVTLRNCVKPEELIPAYTEALSVVLL